MDDAHNVGTVDLDKPRATDPTVDVLLGVYEEVCKSYHAVDDFRMKLLGLLPLVSLVGIFGLGRESIFAAAELPPSLPRLIAFIGVFGVLFTLALFVYEIRGILRCHNLTMTGLRIENALGAAGTFATCVKEHECKCSQHWVERVNGFFDAKLAACFIYATVAASWLFATLHFGFAVEIEHCIWWAVLTGVLFGGSMFALVNRLVAP